MCGACVRLFLVMILAGGPVLAAGAEAPERVTEIVGELKGDTWGQGYAYSSGGCKMVTRGGRLPLGEAGGERAIRIEVTGRGGDWGV